MYSQKESLPSHLLPSCFSNKEGGVRVSRLGGSGAAILRGKAKVVAGLASAPTNSSAGPSKTIFVERVAAPVAREGGGGGSSSSASLVLALFGRGKAPGFNGCGIASAAASAGPSGQLCNDRPVALLFRTDEAGKLDHVWVAEDENNLAGTASLPKSRLQETALWRSALEVIQESMQPEQSFCKLDSGAKCKLMFHYNDYSADSEDQAGLGIGSTSKYDRWTI
jgi:hypothetical protein